MKKTKKLAKILNTAIEKRSSDIYILPQGNQYLVQYCTDGVYQQFERLTVEQAEIYINLFKFNANMNISEKRRPQMGTWNYKWDDIEVNCRLSSVGNFLNQESLVIRLIYQINDLTKQRYFDSMQWEKIIQMCLRRGLILFSGPTGSGKTTSMYELLKCFIDQQILCIEDPIEIFQPDVLQLQVNEQAGMTYDELIKVALRHHPEIFVIGEIRDVKTAQAAIRAALSGHLVLSTVHATSASGAIGRLLNLGVSKQELMQVLKMVNYQRMIPNEQDELQVLFDQIILKEYLFDEIADQNSMSRMWQQKLKEYKNQGRISDKNYRKYLYG